MALRCLCVCGCPSASSRHLTAHASFLYYSGGRPCSYCFLPFLLFSHSSSLSLSPAPLSQLGTRLIEDKQHYRGFVRSEGGFDISDTFTITKAPSSPPHTSLAPNNARCVFALSPAIWRGKTFARAIRSCPPLAISPSLSLSKPGLTQFFTAKVRRSGPYHGMSDRNKKGLRRKRG